MTTKKAHHRGACPHCPRTEDELPLHTVLYNGFGGYLVYKNRKLFFCEDPAVEKPWNKYKTLAYIERVASRSPRARWEVVLSLPLRGATWRRVRGRWILTDTSLGFA